MPPTIEEFVALRGEALVRFALMLAGSRHAAEDLVQSVLAKAIPRWSRVAGMERPEAYVKKMLINEHLSWRRRLWHGEVPTASPGAAAPPAVGDGADEHADREAAWALLGRLPARQRAVLGLRYYEDLTDAEIADILGCRASTVRSQAARGLAALRAVLPAKRRELLR